MLLEAVKPIADHSMAPPDVLHRLELKLLEEHGKAGNNLRKMSWLVDNRRSARLA